MRRFVAIGLLAAACGQSAGAGECPARDPMPIGFFGCDGFPSECQWPTGGEVIACTCNRSTGVGFCCSSVAPPACGVVAPGLPCCPFARNTICPGPNGAFCQCSSQWQCTSVGPGDPDGFSVGPPDLGTGTGCRDVLECQKMCAGDPTCNTQCAAHATPLAQILLDQLGSCFVHTCELGDGFVPADVCESEATSGTSPSGVTLGDCCRERDPMTGGCATVVSPEVPPCGACVDELVACENDL